MSHPLVPAQIQKLPTHAGQPVPFCTSYSEGVPQWDQWHREKIEHCFAAQRCPFCGVAVAKHTAFVLAGLDNIVNRFTKLPPAHTLCAVWAAAEGQMWPPGLVLTLERHDHFRLCHSSQEPAFDFVFLPAPPLAGTWWQDGEALTDPHAIALHINAYEQDAIELCETVDQRSGLNLALAQAREWLEPLTEGKRDKGQGKRDKWGRRRRRKRQARRLPASVTLQPSALLVHQPSILTLHIPTNLHFSFFN